MHFVILVARQCGTCNVAHSSPGTYKCHIRVSFLWRVVGEAGGEEDCSSLYFQPRLGGNGRGSAGISSSSCRNKSLYFSHIHLIREISCSEYWQHLTQRTGG